MTNSVLIELTHTPACVIGLCLVLAVSVICICAVLIVFIKNS